jgi:hypothetical protein
LAIERLGGHDGAFERQQFQQLRHRSDLVRLGVGGYPHQHQTLFTALGADHVQRRFAAGPVERTARKTFPSMATTPWHCAENSAMNC